MFYICNNFHIDRELADKLFSKFEDKSLKGTVKIDSSEEIRSHRECNINITGIINSTEVGSIYFLEFYSAANLIEKFWVDTKDNTTFKEIKSFVEAESGKKLKFDKFISREDSGIF